MTKTQDKQALVPKLRFPEFRGDGEWNSNKLSLLAKPVKEKATKLNPEDVLTLSGEHGLVRQTDYFGKKIAGTDLKRYLRIEQNDFVYNDRTTSSAKYGSLKRLTNYPIGAVSPIYKCFRLGVKEKPVFWEHYFDAGSHEADLSEFINEGARAGRFNISVDTFLSIIVRYPKSHEQQKIADCLGSLDDLIGAHSAKRDALQDHKKGLLQQLFPGTPTSSSAGNKNAGEDASAPSQTTPKLRFPEFRDSGEWEDKKLATICKIQRGKFSHRPRNDPKFFGGKYPFIQTGDVVKSNGGTVVASQSLNEDGLGVSRLFEPTIVLVTIAANIGDTGLLTCKGCFTDSVVGLIPDSCTDPRFLESIVRRQKPRLNAIAAQAAQKNINNEILKDLDLMLPKLSEQQRIADCLSALDGLITAQTNQITTLKEHKKGLMQQLFPNPELSKK